MDALLSLPFTHLNHFVQRTHHAFAAFIQHMGINHRGGNIRMTEQLLHRSDVVAILQQMSGEGVAQSVRRGGLGEIGIAHRLFHRALHAFFIHMMAARLAGARINRQTLRREHILPAPIAPGCWKFFIQRKRQIHLAVAQRQILSPDVL